MSRYRSDPELGDYQSDKPSACVRFLYYTWKTITCLFSHIVLVSMVVSYCVLGAFTFEALEVHHEIDVKRNILTLRQNLVDRLWKLIDEELPVLQDETFITNATKYLREFETALLNAMTKDGWDGEEDISKVQWTSTGALFYSIIVITTIGYGHIAPKTPWGKIVTIFYAILGIPLMLLCLSNIGDIMATSFRFLYWRVCCYICTREPKKRRSRSRENRLSRSRNTSFRRSLRNSTRSADSGFGLSEISPPTFHSDLDIRYRDDWSGNKRGSSLPRMKASQMSRYSEPVRGHSLDRRKLQDIELDPEILYKTAILCNKYVVGGNAPLKDAPLQKENTKRNFLELPQRHSSPTSSDSSIRKHRRKRSPNPSPKMMTPLGYGHRSKYLDDPESDEEYFYDEYYEISRTRIKPVPIWLCVFLVVSYIIAGAFLFNSWETWDVLEAAYFCFITLTTIGFGDLVPAKGVSQDPYRATVSIALCSLYLLFGIALLAMSFNLVQEEVISNIKSIAKTLGIIKKDEDSEDED